jgi:D-alanyl-D-alanine dipeptidase
MLSVVLASFFVCAAVANDRAADDRRSEPLVDVAKACPGIAVELRYAFAENIAGHVIYPRDARCLVRENVAQRLRHAHALLRESGRGLKIWDAYRPTWAQEILWKARPEPEFVGDPAKGGSLHSWGVAVDATLVDRFGRELKMPTDFDALGPAAARRYTGGDPEIAANLKRLQDAMLRAGFLLMRDEWWHFVASDYRRYGPVEPAVSLEPPQK